MIDVKPPEYETTDIYNPTDLNAPGYKRMPEKPKDNVMCVFSDMIKFMELFDMVGIEYEQQGNELWIDAHYSDGKDGFIVKFYEDESFAEFDYIGVDEGTQLHEISKTLKDILAEMRKRK